MVLLRERLAEREFKIYELVQILVDAKLYPWSSTSLISLYQKLFLTQAGLCELYFQLEECGDTMLIVTPVSAFIRKRQSLPSLGQQSFPSDADESVTPNIDFFCDRSNFFSITEDKVQGLLDGFWSKYQSESELQPALDVLNLASNASWPEIRSRYRALASSSHPDKGGDAQRFILIRKAYERLKRDFK